MRAPRQLKRATQVDWPSLISVMRGAAERGEQPFAAAVELSRSLFSTQQVPIGSEHSLSTGEKPCGLWVDAERARFVRRPITEMLNSAGEWEPKPAHPENVSLGQLFVRENDSWVRALDPAAHARRPRLRQSLQAARQGNLRPRNSARDRRGRRRHRAGEMAAKEAR